MTDQQLHVLRGKLREILAQLEALRTDREAMWTLGSMATRLLDDAGIRTWQRLKEVLDAQTYDTLLMSAQQQGQQLLAEGKGTPALMIESLTASIIASRFADADIKTGEALLDEIIEATIALYDKARRTAH